MSHAEKGYDALDELLDLVAAAGGRVTFDLERNIMAFCHGCGAPGPNRLATVGHYTDPTDARGRTIQRPVCSACRRLLGLEAG